MGNTENKLADKGSKYWMQKIVNDKTLRIRLEKKIGDTPLVWYSPLNCESYKEYQLKESKIISNVLGLEKKAFEKQFDFWPSNGPHWDAIATSADGRVLYLFEAKAHLKEIQSKLSATNKDSISIIKNSMREVYQEITASPQGDFSSWFNKYYQLGNRLTFLYRMNQMRLPNIKNVKLVLLNIIDDKTYIPVPQAEWEKHYKSVFVTMIGKTEPPNNVSVLYFSGR